MKPNIEERAGVGSGWRFSLRRRGGTNFGPIGWLLAGVIAIEVWAHASEPVPPPPSASARAGERVVSPTVAAMLARALATAELAKTTKESAPSPVTRVDTKGKSADAAIVMAPYYVSESASRRRLLEAVTRQQNQPKPPAFTLEGGGDLLNFGPATLKIKYDATHKGFDLLKIKF